MKKFTVIGERVPRRDSLAKVTGAAKYTGDLSSPGMLHGKFVRSPHAHARILNIDTSKAERLPGVRAVVTGKDTLGRKFGVFASTRDQQLLTVEKVRYVGEEVACVAAIDQDIADEAVSLIEVEYEPLPAVMDPFEAMKEGAPRLHDQFEHNIGFEVNLEFGNVEEGFRNSDLIREDRFATSKVHHATMEPYSALAIWDPSGKLDVWVPNQSPFTKRRGLANALGLQVGTVRVRNCCLGGAFGGRSDTFPAEFCAALLSMKSGRPVRIGLTGEETTVAMRHKHSMVIDIKTGMRKDGTIMARDVKAVLDGGAYLSSGPMATVTPYAVTEPIYRNPNLRYKGYRVYTNKTPCSMMRTHPNQIHMAEDVQMEIMAEELGLDPLEIRINNAIQTGERLPSKSIVTSSGMTEALKRATDEARWKEKRGKLGQGRGIGVACGAITCGFNLGWRSNSSAVVKFDEAGGAVLFSGNIDNGQGNETMLVQIAAEELGIPMDDIRLVCGDTELCPPDPGTYSMTSVYISGNAVKAAASDARKNLLNIAAGYLAVPAETLEVRDRMIYSKGNPGKTMPVAKAVTLGLLKGQPVVGVGQYIPETEGMSNDSKGLWEGQIGWAYNHGAVVAEAEVDKETGVVKVLNLVTANDVGRAINPRAVEGQMEGMAVMALGETLYEKLVWDEESKGLMTVSPLDYKIPTAVDTPNLKPIIVESIDPNGPYGAKEAGIGGGAALSGAIANAIYDAIGVRIKELPITPELILRLLEEKGKSRK